MRKTIKSAILICSTAFTLAGCGGDSGSSSSGGGSKVKSVYWSMSNPEAGPYCRDPDTKNEFSGQYSSSISCIWHCANYKGRSKVYVSIRFRKLNQPGAVWRYDGDYVSSGICF